MWDNENLDRLREMRTPFYYYDMGLLDETLDVVSRTSGQFGFHVHYAVKANSNPKVLKRIADAGLGADCVSGNEIKRSIECGFKSEDVVFAGVGKTDEEIAYALDQGILCFNVESIPELKVIDQIARDKGRKARIALRLNPNIGADTHAYITTGLKENKFGIGLHELDHLIDLIEEMGNVDLIGLHFHIGSQITNLEPFRNLCIKVNDVQELLKKRGVTVQHLNMGGGLGINYSDPDMNPIPAFEQFFKLFDRFLKRDQGQQVHFELGRSIVGTFGSLVSRVLYVKEGINTKFLILDAGMTDLIRPALYQSHHPIRNVSKMDKPSETAYDVVGPVCESSDCFGKQIDLPESERGDLIVIRCAGAYGETMVSNYNLRTPPGTVFSDEIPDNDKDIDLVSSLTMS